MGKRVVIIASGDTERRSLPHLVRHLCEEGIVVVEVRRPDGNKALDPEMAERLVKAAWYAWPGTEPLDKFVILVDADGNDPEQVLRPFRERLPGRLRPRIAAGLQFACAQWHLEAWYFADPAGLREYLGRNIGEVDASRPDEIRNPKLHLKHLLGERAYTAIVSEEIAQSVDVQTMTRSVSFLRFLDAVRNGSSD